MPNWLSDAWNAANTPLVPKQAIKGMQDSLEEPHLDQSPLMAGIKGFGSGTLEGLRGLTSPIQLAGIASLAGGGGLGVLGKGAQTVSKLAPVAEGVSDLTNIVPDLVDAAPAVKQVMPTMQDSMDLTGLLKHNLAKIPQAGTKGAIQGLQGALPAEMIAPGQEGLYNAARAATQAIKPTPQPLLRPLGTSILGQ
jgi:hypothetical protein